MAIKGEQKQLYLNGGIDMASKLTIRKLALIVASTGMAGAIHSGAQAAEQIDCNSGLTQIAIMSQQGGEDGIWPAYAHCVSGAQGASPAFTTKEARARAGVAGRPAVLKQEHAWPDQTLKD